MSGWQQVATLADFGAADLTDVLVGREVVCLVRSGGEVVAVQGLCPHAFARLAEGRLEGALLVCPQHLARFRLSDGVCSGGWVLPPLRRYAVRLEGDALFLPDPLEPL